MIDPLLAAGDRVPIWEEMVYTPYILPRVRKSLEMKRLQIYRFWECAGYLE